MKKIFQRFIVFAMLIAIFGNLCVTPVLAAHTHKGVMCGKQVTWYEKKDGTNHTKVTAYENLCSCGEVLGTIDEVRKSEKHSFSGDTCTKCKYTKTHTHKGVACGDKVTWYEKKDANNHTYYTAYENLCSCGAKLGLIDQTSKTQSHSWNGDTCSKCGYTRTHTHKGVMCGDLVTWYDNITSSTHTYYAAFENICSCGANLGLIDQTSTTQNHVWNGDTCYDCGYTRAHTHKAVMCGKNLTWYDNITSDSHTKYSGYEELCSCGKVMGKDWSSSVTSSHSWDGDTCYECGYTRAHVHQGVMCGKYETWYEYDATYHTKYGAYEDICSCGKVLGWTDMTSSTTTHDFDGDICEDCGYQRAHVHQGVMCGKYEVWYEYNSSTHTKYGAYEDICSCGKVLGWTDMTTSTTTHSFDGDKCSECGYERAHVHKGVMCGEKITTLKSYDENGHTYTIAYENLCSCGEYLGLIDETTSTTSHNFKNDVCSDCGYQRTHTHSGVACGKQVKWYENATADGHTLVTANEALCSCGAVVGTVDRVDKQESHSFSNDECTKCGYNRATGHTHVAVMTGNNGFTFYSYVNENKHHKVVYEGDHLCSCGAVVENGEYTTYEEAHNVKNGKCTLCDAEIHVHKPDREAETGLFYSYSDENQHVRIRVSSGSYCKCGAFIPEDGESVTYTHEAHTMVDQKCTKCGYSSKSYGQVVIEQSILGDFSDDVNVGGIAGQIIVGEIPFVGFVADVRDLLASETIVDVGINLVGFIPFVGSLKYSDEVYTVVKHADDIEALIDNADEIYEAAQAVMKHGDEAYAAGKIVEVSRVADNFDEGFDSYSAFKRVHGSAGSGYEWHHIVEQSQIGKSGFDTKLIQNAGNIIPLDAATHRKVSGYYSRLVPGTNMSFRDWIAYKGFSYEQQQKIGEYVLEIYGVKVK